MGQLADIATSLKGYADRLPGVAAKQRLKHGLMLSLKREGVQYVLALGREDVWPASNEIAICLREFGAPPDTKPENDTQGEIRIVRLRWTVPGAQLTLPMGERL